jgi:hypothetical protein
VITAAFGAGVLLPDRSERRPVVLELFTSQGCSSCPPADALLGRLSRRTGVIALAWHVDYWDRLGWRDPFAGKFATERQRRYATAIGAEVFTPALVVNGAAMLVGSERGAIEDAMVKAAPLPVPVTLSRTEDAVNVFVGPAPGRVRAQRIIYDPEHATDVRAGENEGTQLREYRIVRAVETLAEWDVGNRSFRTPSPDPGQGVAIVVQSPELRVLGAADLPPG